MSDHIATIDLMTTVALTRTRPRCDPFPRYTTNDGRVYIEKMVNERWSVGPTEGDRPFVCDLDSLEAAVDFVLGARAMLAPAEDY